VCALQYDKPGARDDGVEESLWGEKRGILREGMRRKNGWVRGGGKKLLKGLKSKEG